MKRIAFSAAASLLLAFVAKGAQSAPFALHNGDRVVFYGDSITDNAPYTSLIEMFVSTRYPGMDVSFMNAGVGGDRVSGGWMGAIDDRMSRDLFSRRPTVITCMLGMNDGGYVPFRQDIFDYYRQGYEHMADRIRKEAPDARVWLIRPSPYDDVTREGGYNQVLIKYGDFVQELAARNHFNVVDLNAPLVAVLKGANAEDSALAQKIIPDRIHPTPAGHLVMAAEILKAWHADPLVSDTVIDWNTGKATTQNATLRGWSNGSFSLLEKALPMPIARKEPTVALMLKSYDFDGTLNRENLRVTGMPAGNYTLNIDGKPVGAFSDHDFENGVNLATLVTPMSQQADQIAGLTQRLDNLRYDRWRNFEVGLADAPKRERDAAIQSIERLEAALDQQRRQAAKPVEHRFQIVVKG